jgi:protein-S-isoprenylcysteine O-methyltransferase Ste14
MASRTPEQREKRKPLYSVGGVMKVLVTLATLIGFMALLAGRLDWIAGWTFLGIFTVYSLVLFVWLSRIDPELARERQHDTDERNQPYERVIIPVMVMLELALLVIAALDGGRFGWSTVPVWVRAIGWSLLAVTGTMLPWVFRTNTFASGVGRIQDDRDHRVITGGPYRFVRHPMYVGVIVAFIGLPLALGSWWALIPGVLLILTFIYRTWREDQFLTASLPGYEDYAQHTRYRLLPGIW